MTEPANDIAHEVRDNPERCRYELIVDDRIVSIADYSRDGATLVVPHVETDPAMRGQGMADRLMRGMNRYYDSTQHLHGSSAASRLTSRSQALLWNFAPWHPSETRQQGWQSPAERLNTHRYHADWLQNLLISASCAGYRIAPHEP